MKRRILGTLLIIASIAGVYFWYLFRKHVEKSALRRHQEVLVRLYEELPPLERAKADPFLSTPEDDWKNEIAHFSSNPSFELGAFSMRRIQVAVQPGLRPVPILGGKFQPVLSQRPMLGAPTLTEEEETRILRYANSVGRIEVRKNSDYALVGTGFVISTDVIATNCHVVREVAEPGAVSGTFALKSDGVLLIDFGDSPAHEAAREFKVQTLEPCPKEGLDVAFLRVEDNNIDGRYHMPPPLSLIRSIPSRLGSGQEVNVGEIGYPDLADVGVGTPTRDLFRQFDKTKYAKFYTPGAVTAAKPQGGVDFLFHIVSTWPGESGSPLLDVVTQDVVGVDACCDRTLGPLPPPSDLRCATRLLVSPANLAISSWSVVGDPVLGSLIASKHL